MGDRGQLCVLATYPGVKGRELCATYAFTHWRGEGLPERIRHAIQRARPRYADPLYMTRILYDALAMDEQGTLDGYALGPRPLDTEAGRPMLVVNLDKRSVGTAAVDRWSPLPIVDREIPWAAYVLRERTWKTLFV